MTVLIFGVNQPLKYFKSIFPKQIHSMTLNTTKHIYFHVSWYCWHTFRSSVLGFGPLFLGPYISCSRSLSKKTSCSKGLRLCQCLCLYAEWLCKFKLFEEQSTSEHKAWLHKFYFRCVTQVFMWCGKRWLLPVGMQERACLALTQGDHFK